MTLPNKVQQFTQDADKLNAIVHGPAAGPTSTVNTDGGPVRTIARLVADKSAEFDAGTSGSLQLTQAAVADAKNAAAAAAIMASPANYGYLAGGDMGVPIFPDESMFGSGALFNESMQAIMLLPAGGGLPGTVGGQLDMAPMFADESFSMALLAADGVSVAFGVKTDGTMFPVPAGGAAVLSAADRTTLDQAATMLDTGMDETYAWWLRDSSGNVLLGVRLNGGGTDVPALNIPNADWHAFTDAAGAVQVDSSAGAVVKVASTAGVARNPTAVANQVAWVDDVGGAIEARRFRLDAGTNLPATVGRIVFVPLMGQSLACGSGGYPIKTTAPTWPGRSWTFNGGSRPQQGSTFVQPDDLVMTKDTQLLQLQELVEQFAPGSAYYGETQGGGLSWWMGAPGRMAADTVMVFSTVAVGGASVGQLAKGGKPYTNLIRQAERLKAICQLRDWAFEVPCVLWDQGEVNYTTSAASYIPQLRTLQANLTADLNAITGAAGQVPLVIQQPSSWTHYGFTTAEIIPAMLAECIAQPTKFKTSGPQYWIANYGPDGLHGDADFYRKSGEIFGRAAAAVRAGAATGGLYATAAAANGAQLTITFNAATQLALDTARVTDPGQYGLRVFSAADGTEVALSAIAVLGANQIIATLATPLAGAWFVGIADKGVGGALNVGPAAGPRSCIRDTSPDVSSYGQPLFNWAGHQTISINIS